MKLSRLISSTFCIAAILSSLGGGVHAMPVPGHARGVVLFVKVIETGVCSSWENACDLQTALSSAVAGDEIWVAEGTYYPTNATNRTLSFQLKSGVAVYGGFDGTETTREERDWVQNLTILSGDLGVSGKTSDNSYHVVYSSAVNSSALLDGFTITGGYADGDEYPHDSGGGMTNSYFSSPTLTNVTFSGNSAIWYGGGLCNDYSNPILINVTFSTNSAGYGGGMRNAYSSPALTNVTFSGNSATYGGGMRNDDHSNPTLTNVTFSGNSAVHSGGGMHNDYSSYPKLTNVTFSGNSAEYGGGMRNDGHSNPTLTNVTFAGNSAWLGGGMFNYYSSPTLTNVTFSGNSAEDDGGGMTNKYFSSPTLTNVTFSGNSAAFGSGGGIFNWNYSSPALTNNILWGNGPSQIHNYDESIPVITYSLVQGGYGGEGNISGDPILGLLADNDGFTQTHALLSGSPAIDAGSPTVCPAMDQRGYLRPIDGNGDGTSRCDMGAYEFGSYMPYYSYLPLIVK